MKIDDIMLEGYGSTGKKEEVKSITRVFNADRYIEAYAELANSEIKFKALAAEYRSKLSYYENHMAKAKQSGNRQAYKAYSEGFSDIKDKVVNFGKDLWRTIKKLLGKLIIFLEEQIAYIFDRAKYVEKLLDKLSSVIRRITRWGVANSDGTVTFRPGSNSSELILPLQLDRSISIEWFRSNLNLQDTLSREGNFSIAKDSFYNYRNIMGELEQNGSNLDFNSAVANALEGNNNLISFYRFIKVWKRNGLSKEKKMRSLAKEYKVAAKTYKNVIKMVKDPNGSPSSSNGIVPNDDDNYLIRDISGNHGVEPAHLNRVRDGIDARDNSELSQFLAAGALLEMVEGVLRNKKIYQDKIIELSLASIRLNDDDYGNKLSALLKETKVVFILLCMALSNFTNMRDIYFEYRKTANELRNAPTEITDRYSKEVCHGVNMIISRSTKAAHSLLKSAKTTMMTYAKMGMHAVEVLDKLDKVFESTHEIDDRIVGKTK